MAIRGAVIGIEIKWNCNLDWDFMTYCLPKYRFDILDSTGWNFRHAIYHEENRRTLVKAYGMKFLINVNGIAGKFDITKTVIIIVTGLGLMGITNILCDIVLLKIPKYREQIAEKKFERVQSSNSREDEDVLEKGLKNIKNILHKRNTSLSRKTASDGMANMLGMANIVALLPVNNEPSENSSPSLTQNNTTKSCNGSKSNRNSKYLEQIEENFIEHVQPNLDEDVVVNDFKYGKQKSHTQAVVPGTGAMANMLTMASLLNNNGTPEQLSPALTHSTITTTENTPTLAPKLYYYQKITPMNPYNC